MLALLCILAFFQVSCETAKKYVESGDYDSAIDLCVQKLRGKENKKTEYVQGLELAFKKAQDRDLATIKHYQEQNRGEYWERIHDLHLEIRARQNKVLPLIPLTSKKGYKAQFNFVDIGRMESDSRAKAADYLYNQAVTLLESGERGDKLAARKAYEKLLELGRKYYSDYRDKANLIVKAREYGISYVLLEVKNQSGKILPRDFSERLLTMSKQDLDSEWKEFFFEVKPGEQFDYTAVFKIKDISISPERVSERAYTDEKDIQDGWNYVLDKRGNVMKDTLGNDIKTPRMVRIRADVLEVHQSKAARLAGYVEIFDVARNTLLDSQDLSTEVLFEHYAATFKGDERALSKESRMRIGSSPVPFPLDQDMLVQAAERLKPGLREELRCSRAIL